MIDEKWLDDIRHELERIYVEKNHDYGNSAFDTFVHYGDVALIIRIEDKLRRLQKLKYANSMVKSESIDDTYKDAINYMIILIGCRLTGRIEYENERNTSTTLGVYETIFDKAKSEPIAARIKKYDTVTSLRDMHKKHRFRNPSIDEYIDYTVGLIYSYYYWKEGM